MSAVLYSKLHSPGDFSCALACQDFPRQSQTVSLPLEPTCYYHHRVGSIQNCKERCLCDCKVLRRKPKYLHVNHVVLLRELSGLFPYHLQHHPLDLSLRDSSKFHSHYRRDTHRNVRSRASYRSLEISFHAEVQTKPRPSTLQPQPRSHRPPRMPRF